MLLPCLEVHAQLRSTCLIAVGAWLWIGLGGPWAPCAQLDLFTLCRAAANHFVFAVVRCAIARFFWRLG